jgi:hypothetical protein
VPTQVFPIAADSDDGWGVYLNGSAWPGATNGGTFTDGDTFDPTIVLVSKRDVSLENGWGLLRFETGAVIPGTATITASELQLTIAAAGSDFENLAMVADYYDFGGEPVVPGDWIETASPSIIGSQDISTFNTVGVTYNIALTDLTGIKRAGESNAQGFTGWTGIRLTLSAISPPTASSVLLWASRENVTYQEPRLSVTWTEAPTGGPIAWVRA